MVNNKVNDMFEQQQNTGKSASLAEKYANTVGQLSEANDRAAHAERIRKELEAQFVDKAKELEERNKALNKRESDVIRKRRPSPKI